MRPELLERATIWSRHEHARRVLRRVQNACAAEDIRVLPVKGVLTAYILHRDPSDRRILDIDLRVAPRDFPRLRAMAAKSGFRVASHSRAYRNLVLEVDGMQVEFEAHLGPPGLCSLPMEAVLARATQRDAPFGFPHLQPELHDHALLLVINAFKDKLWEAQPWAIRDLELLGTHPGFDPARLAALARENGVAALTWLVADWLVETRGEGAWVTVRDALSTAPRARYRAIMGAILRKGTPPVSFLPRVGFRVMVRACSDPLRSQARSLGLSLAWTLEQRWARMRGV